MRVALAYFKESFKNNCMIHPMLIPFPFPIETERLLLRPPQPGDGQELMDAMNESYKELKDWMPWAKPQVNHAEAEVNVRNAYAQFILRKDIRISIFDKNTKKLVGSTGLHSVNWEVPHYSIGYWVRSSYAGKGIIIEAVSALSIYAFKQLKAKKVIIKCDSDNEKSKKVAKGLGYKLEATLKFDSTKRNPKDAKANVTRDTLIFARTEIKGLVATKVSWPQK